MKYVPLRQKVREYTQDNLLANKKGFYKESIYQTLTAIIEATLEYTASKRECGFPNQSKTARIIGISRRSLLNIMKEEKINGN